MSAIRYRSSDRRFLDPNLSVDFRNFILKLIGAFLVGLIIAPALFAWAGGAQ